MLQRIATVDIKLITNFIQYAGILIFLVRILFTDKTHELTCITIVKSITKINEAKKARPTSFV